MTTAGNLRGTCGEPAGNLRESAGTCGKLRGICGNLRESCGEPAGQPFETQGWSGSRLGSLQLQSRIARPPRPGIVGSGADPVTGRPWLVPNVWQIWGSGASSGRGNAKPTPRSLAVSAAHCWPKAAGAGMRRHAGAGLAWLASLASFSSSSFSSSSLASSSSQ